MINITSILINKDFDRAESSGAGGFQISSIDGFDENGEEYDITKYVSQGEHYYDDKKVLEDLVNGAGKDKEYYIDNDCDIQ